MKIETQPWLSEISEPVVGANRRVPLLDGSRAAYVNLDNAASTPAFAAVAGAVNEFLEWYASVHRGAGFKSRVATQAYEDARAIVGGFVGARPDEHTVIFGKNASEAINKLAWRLPFRPEDVVLVSAAEHHSNDLPWRPRARVVHIGVDAEGRLDEADFDRLLAVHAGRVRLVAVTGGSNVTGAMSRVHDLAARAHAAGAEILVDCAQLAPHRAIDIGALDDPRHLDYVALSAHKMYAPFGTGALIGRRDTFARGAPEYRGGGTIQFVSDDDVIWAEGPDRDEAGSPNVVGAVAMAVAAQRLQAIGMAAVASHEAALTGYALRRLGAIEGLRIYGDADPGRAAERLGVISFNLGALPHGLVAARLSAEFGIGMRNGCFCAHPLLVRLLGLDAAEVRRLRARLEAGDRSALPGMVRASFGVYNTAGDVDRLAGALAAIASGGGEDYVQDAATGDFAPRGWTPEAAGAFRLRR